MTATWDDFQERNRQAMAALPLCECCQETIYPDEPKRGTFNAHLCTNCDEEHEQDIVLCLPCMTMCSEDIEDYGLMDSRCEKDKYVPTQRPEPVPENQGRML